MLLDDLGGPVREASEYDGARAAVRLYMADAVADGPWLPRVDSAGLAVMPQRIADSLGRVWRSSFRSPGRR